MQYLLFNYYAKKTAAENNISNNIFSKIYKINLSNNQYVEYYIDLIIKNICNEHNIINIYDKFYYNIIFVNKDNIENIDNIDQSINNSDYDDSDYECYNDYNSDSDISLK